MRVPTGWMKVGSLFLLLVAGQALAAADDGSVRLALVYGTMQPPASGSAYTDPVFGTSIKRITNALSMDNADRGGKLTWIENEYSTASPFSNDNSRLILLHQSYFGLYDGDGNFLGSLPLEVNSSSEPRWSRKDNSTLYYHSGNQLKSYDASTGFTNVVHTFSEYASISGKGEMDISQDGDHFVFAGDDRYVFVYIVSTDRKLAAFDTGGRAFDSLYITPDNNVTITWLPFGINTRYTGIELFDSNMNFLRQVAHVGGHMHMSRDLNGEEVLIWTNSNDLQPACGQNAIVKIRLNDGAQSCLLSLDWSLAVHISAADDTWAFVETYNPSDVIPPSGWFPYTDELLQIKLDGSEVRRLAHHRSRPLNSYNYMPKLSVSRDGSRLVYASNFGLQVIAGAPQQYSDEYMIVIAPPDSVVNGVAVVNSASFRAATEAISGVAPGSIVSVFGTGLAGATQSAANAPMPEVLADTAVSFNNVPAPLFYVSPNQINAQVPFGLPPGDVTVEVRQLSSSVVRQTITVAPAAPGVFTTNQRGTGPGVVLHAADFSLVTESAPAHPGEYLSVFCTGLGQLKSFVADGNAAPYPPAETVLAPEVRVGNILASVTFSGLAPGYVGLYQVNVQVPMGAPTGIAVPLVLVSGGVSSNTVTIAIQ
jgi:uncharacterized protein (TIGR03437 family)